MGVEGESPPGWYGDSKILSHDPGSLGGGGGGSSQPAPCPRPAALEKDSSSSCQQLAVTLASGPSSAGRDSAWLLPGASELGRREWLLLIKQKLQAEREKGQGMRVHGTPQARVGTLSTVRGPFGPRTVPEPGTELEAGKLRFSLLPTGTSATASHSTESA